MDSMPVVLISAGVKKPKKDYAAGRCIEQLYLNWELSVCRLGR